MLSDLTTRLNAFCARYAYFVIAIFIIFCSAAGWLSLHNLGITTETDKLFSDSLPWKQRNAHLDNLFPEEKGSLVAIIDAKTPEEGRETAHQLALTLKGDKNHFVSVTEPDANPYYTHNAFLFLDADTLESLLDSTIAAQPFLGTLSADPSARGLFNIFGLMATGIKSGQELPSNFTGALGEISNTLDQASRGNSQPLSWQKMLAGKLQDMGGRYQFVVTQPRSDFSSFEPSAAATQAMRTAINNLPTVKEGRSSALITGEAKLSDEEFSTVADGMIFGLILSLALVTLWLILAVRSWRIIVPILFTLIAGLLLTTGFAAIGVGTLNLISVAFAILFVGIAVDFAIQYAVRFRNQSSSDGKPLSRQEAIKRTGKESGGQIFVAALATAAGFMGFTPTSFIGVAQLGLIAGVGMIIAFFCTLTLLPALLTLFRAVPSIKNHTSSRLLPVDIFLRRRRRPIIGIFALLGLTSLFLTSALNFDSDPLHTKNPNTEGMKALSLLEENPLTTPYNAQFLLKNKSDAEKQAKDFSALSSVHDVLWLGALVPEDQNTKLQLIHDAADILLPSLTVSTQASTPSAQDLRDAAFKASQLFADIDTKKLNPTLQKIQNSLKRLSIAPDATILTANRALTRFLPDELSQLRSALTPSPVSFDDIPNDIRSGYLSKDGYYRLVVHPKGQMSNPGTLHQFITDLHTVNPDIAGPALDITASAHTITHAFIIAATLAIISIAIILLITLRRLLDSLLVVIPLILSSLLTVILIVLVPEPLNFANIIALPLLLGVGVSFNIYFVMNWRAGLKHPLTSPTAHAVLFSALTTGSAFGSLAASAHPGTASMGRLLLLSLSCTLMCSLFFIPALLPRRPKDDA